MSTTATLNENETASRSAFRTVQGEVNYLGDQVDAPFYELRTQFDGPRDNHALEPHTVSILDLSASTSEQRKKVGYTVEEAGFEILDGWGDEGKTAPSWAAQKWDEPGWIEKEYYADVDALLKKHVGATSTFIFDHTVRKRRTEDQLHLPDTPDSRTPVSFVHSDQTKWAGENRVLKHLGQDVLDRVQSGKLRAQIINVWRPLRGTALDMPLAFSDSRSVQPGDWVVNQLRYETWNGQTYMIHFNEGHKWYFYRGLPTNKAILLKCYDSTSSVRTPHTGFKDPGAPADAEPRWSIEVRAIVLTELE
ncbi:unnamed protein product [Tilletia controversa]|uniref:Methyltransferase n=3 Tax=Tilletia TaxID=13289 RepID=A0A8X7MTP2_9BASI|nr:hypothetical protein CF336_g3441 [Tilletia laevis]KAE8199796.1 hypothetical protein CF328_g3145 [Tilletia controversa]KAE8262427.1 hypothetical protein A4X03_0g2460 [Tilletia caries]KAE8204716.1 hypothetical protein CF335_g2553 [Tilletia laevis]KAE8248171.1 hypothetical protein A4X06_0g3907 [Tilletia controversa]